MVRFNDNVDKEIVIDVISEKLNEVVEKRTDSLHSIDIIAIAYDLYDSFSEILSFVSDASTVLKISKYIINKLNKLDIPINQDDIREIVDNILQKINIKKDMSK